MRSATSTTLEGAADPFASEFRRALARLDSRGRLTAPDARALRRLLACVAAEGRSFDSWEPEDLLGPFDGLRQEGKRAIVDVVEAAERWRLRGRRLGKWQAWVARSLNSPRLRRAGGQLASFAASVARSGPRRFLSGMRGLALECQSRIFPRPTVASLLHRSGIKPWKFAVCYARGIAQPAGYRGFWHDSERRITIGSVLGIDLIPSAQGYWLAESNLDIGLRLERTSMYARDPFASSLLDVAQEGGYGRLLIIAPNTSAIDELMSRQLEEEAAARRIQLTILEDPFLRNVNYRRADRIPDLEKDGTLVLRMKYYRTNLDYILDHKAGSYRALRAFQERTRDSDFLLPPTSPDPPASSSDPSDPFPNLVYKFPERDSGTGLLFLKATSAAHARSLVAEAARLARPRSLLNRLYTALEDRNGLYQTFVRGTLLEGRRLYGIRAYVFVSPVGTRFLCAHRTVSSHPVPEKLPPGIVSDWMPFLVSRSQRSRMAVLPADEEPAVARAALGVARGLAWAAAYGFLHAPNG